VRDERTGKIVRPAYIFQTVEPNESNPDAQRLELSNRVRSGQLDAFLEIGEQALHPGTNRAASRVAYYAKNAAMDEVRRWVGGPINEQLRKARLAEAGVDETRVKGLFDWRSVEGMGLVRQDARSGEIQPAKRHTELEAIAAPMVAMLLMVFLVMMGAGSLLNSVMEEKNQRIAEVLLGSADPFEIMLGKILGGVGVSLTGSAFYLLGGVFVVSSMGVAGYVPFHVLPWFFTFMLLNILMQGSIFAALGSLCSDPKDAQSLMLPAMLPVMIPMFLLGPILQHPNSSLAAGLSLFPLFTPVLMIFRQSTPLGVAAWQPWVGLIGVILWTLLCVWVGGRIFRVGILMQGKPPRLGQVVRWATRG
jgi:ABC-2 type transport system permease protein